MKRLLGPAPASAQASPEDAIAPMAADEAPAQRPEIPAPQTPGAVQAKKHKFPDWPEFLAASPQMWTKALETAKGGPRVLFASAIGGHPQFTVVESALAIALTMRGAQVDTLICDAVAPACQRAKVSLPGPKELIGDGLYERVCPSCVVRGRKVFDVPGLDALQMSAFLTDEDRAQARATAQSLAYDQLAGLIIDGVPVGEHALAGALRYYGVGDLSREPLGEPVLRRYVEAGLITHAVMKRLLAARAYDVVVTNHGIYSPHGIINAAALRAGARTVTWNTAYRKQCAIFSHGDTYHHTLIDEPTSAWEDMAWSSEREAEIVAYLDSRRYGARDWIWFNRFADEDLGRFAERTGLDWSKPVVGMLTNVIWDAQLHYPANAFANMQDWILRTIDYFRTRPDLQLVIRVHPGELAPPGDVTVSRQPVAGIIRDAFPDLPPNVFVVPPEDTLSTYALAERCDSVLIYGTKTGVEVTSMGVPTIVAGEAWIRGKGVTLDAVDAADYFAKLGALPVGRRLDEATVRRARQYAYHFFFRRMIPLPFLEYREDHWPPFVMKLKGLFKLGPGRYPGLDVICDGILHGKPFIYPAETLGLHDAEPATAP